jgi:hypothetical protein
MQRNMEVRMTSFVATGSRLIALALAGLMSACGGGGGSSTEAPPQAVAPIATAADNHFPLDSEARRVYVTSAAAESVIVRTAGMQLVEGVSGTVLLRQDLTNGTVHRSVYVSTASGVRQYSAAAADAIERAFDGTNAIRFPARAGDSFVQLDTTIDSGRDFDGDGRADRVTLRAEVTVIAIETVSVPAGTFSNVLHQRQTVRQTVLPASGAAPFNIEANADTWYAPNIGVIKSVVAQRAASADITTTESLTKYRVGTQSNDTVSPAAQGSLPISLTSAASATISAVFSEEMDEASFAAGVFALVDAAGRSVAGVVQVQGRTIGFVPAVPLKSGFYSATISTAAQDLVGNRLITALGWSFVVDAAAPGVASSFPAAESINVALNVIIGLNFNETPALASVNSGNIRLSDGTSLVTAELQVNGNGVAVHPVSGLKKGTRYTLDVAGVTDLAGNPMAQGYRLNFDTTPGRFGNTERLYPTPYVYADVIGDVNGDGIPDIVFTADTSSTAMLYQFSLFVRHGRAGGSFGEAVRVDVGPMSNFCDLNALAIGDVTGDGRPDLVVGSLICGVQVLKQSPSGTLTLGQYLDSPANSLRLADFDKDGRLDLVAVSDSSNFAHLWRQSATGTLDLVETAALGGEFARDVEVGDLDGDGRLDLVVSLVVAGRSPNLAVLRQQTDGHFAAPEFLSTGSLFGATAVALGDVNGDGRLDIVATTGGNSPTWFAVFYQAADGSFPLATQVPTHDGPWGVRVVDVDKDGRSDIVISHRGQNLVGVYLQRSGGTLNREELYDAPSGPVCVQNLAVGDVDGDGMVDIVVAGELLRQVPLGGGGALGATRRQMQGARAASGRTGAARQGPVR